jgi:RTX calcium-binding nonapeptide repeat (4 copies)/Dolichyl-phosphate-mannose-protein mannosyltransferase
VASAGEGRSGRGSGLAARLRAGPTRSIPWRLVGFPAGVGLALIVFSGRYGPHRDELYFLAAGRHLAWGYPDQGPLTPLLAAVADVVAPDSLLVLRLAPALAAGGTVLLTGMLARELGGGRRAQLIATACMGVATIVLATGHLLSTATFDLLAWTAVTWLAVRAVRTGEHRNTPREQYLLDSAHHGLAMNPEGKKLCAAGTMSDYAAIVNRSTFAFRIVRVGEKPYWSTNSGDGKLCFVSVSGNDRVVAISYKSGREVARITVGDHPQRMRIGVIRSSLVGGGPDAGGPACTIRGTPRDDRLRGTPRVDVICGGGGDDVMSGLDGDDHLRGGPGADVHAGQEGRDFIDARDGDDEDVANGGPGDDFCETDRGDARNSC